MRGLPGQWALKDITNLFVQIGPLGPTKHVTSKDSRMHDLACVAFLDPKDAKRALEAYNGKVFLESKLQIEYLANQKGPIFDTLRDHKFEAGIN